ncbi:unnamed protein product [Closterium sp. NIES-53]
MVGMVEPTVSLAPKASKDFQVVEAAVQANPMAVLLNSGCSHHLMGTKAAFVDMAPSDIVKHVCGFNGALQPVKGRGTIALQGEYRCVLIPDVLYVPGVNTNLLSAGQLKESEVQLQGDGDEMLLVATTGKVLGRARYTGRVLCTDLRPCSMRSPSTKVVALRMIVSATKSTLDRWHARLAHVGVDTIKSSAKHEVATGLDIKPSTGADPPCVSCVGGKLARHTFPNKGSDTKEALAVVHIDLCGPFWVAAKDGSLYFLLLKDRHTRLVWAMPVAKKSDVLREFQQWLVLVKRRTKKSVLMLRPDRGGEFIGKEITNFVNRKGIIHNLTCPYTPQQNGMAEREMRLVVESVQTMLLHMGVQNHWWHLAPRQAVWVRNCMALASGISPIKVSKSDVVEVPIEKPELRYTGQTRKPPEWMVFHARLPPGAFTTLLEDAEADVDLPKLYPDVHADLKYRWDFATMTVKEALASWKRKAVKAAMDEEIRSLINMGTWELVERPRGGFTQVYDADCGETYSPVSSYVTLRIFLSIVAVLDLNLMQLDMKNTFLHNKLDQVLYMYQPDYFDDGTDRYGRGRAVLPEKVETAPVPSAQGSPATSPAAPPAPIPPTAPTPAAPPVETAPTPAAPPVETAPVPPTPQAPTPAAQPALAAPVPPVRAPPGPATPAPLAAPTPVGPPIAPVTPAPAPRGPAAPAAPAPAAPPAASAPAAPLAAGPVAPAARLQHRAYHSCSLRTEGLPP